MFKSNYSTIHPNAIQASAQKLYPQERSLLLNTLCDTVHTQSRLTISTHLWGVPAPEDADETHATTWVAKAIHDYHVGMEWDERLYFDYQWDFEGWTRELFQKGVYTGKFRARVADSLFNLLGGENAPEWDPAEFKAEKFDERSEAYQRQQNAHLAAPIDRQAQQPLQQTQPLEPLQPQPQRPSQGEQYRVRQGVRSHPQYQELQQPPYAINAYAGPQPRQTEQAMQPQQWYPQTQTRPPATAYREIVEEFLINDKQSGSCIHIFEPLDNADNPCNLLVSKS
ncbi:hypothetical protein A1F94_001239 [Pyrenophora tritici-repentis]|nr:hypothetical protein A1F94_001239 [Pyrenophora tritici-repentis]